MMTTSIVFSSPAVPGSSPPAPPRPCIVYVHGNPWSDVPGRQRYLMQEMARWYDVLYLENAERRRWRVTTSPLGNGVSLVQGLLPMWSRFERRRWLWAQRASTRHFLGHLRKRPAPVILWNAENGLHPCRYVPHHLAIFDCIDPCFSTDPEDVRAFEQRDAQMCRAADLVFASANTLVHHCRQFAPAVHLLNNACHPDEYANDLLAAAPRPDWWPSDDRPIAAFLGTLDARFDFHAVDAAIRANPNVHFLLAGRILDHCRPHIDRLLQLPNVRCPGSISIEHGRHLLSRSTIGLIPFAPGPMNDAINPVKMYAHALLGKPIVGTAIAELLARPDIVRTAATPEAFAAAIPKALADAALPATAPRLRAFAAANTWAHRAADAHRIITDRLAAIRLPKSPRTRTLSSAGAPA